MLFQLNSQGYNCVQVQAFMLQYTFFRTEANSPFSIHSIIVFSLLSTALVLLSSPDRSLPSVVPHLHLTIHFVPTQMRMNGNDTPQHGRQRAA